MSKLTFHAGMEILVKHGLNINEWTSNEGLTAVHLMAKEGQLEVVKTLVEVMQADIDSRCRAYNRTPLWYATQRGHTPIVAYLLSQRARVGDGVCVLHEAAYRGYSDIVTELIKAGADCNEEVRQGGPPASLACRAYTAEGGSTWDTRTKDRILTGKTESLRLILAAGGNVKAIRAGRSLLHSAAENGLAMLVPVLAARGIDLDIVSGSYPRNSALHVACIQGSKSFVEELVRAGANLETPNWGGRTPLFDAIRRNHSDIVRTLVRLGASVVAADVQNVSLLHAACAYGKVESAYILLEAGADVHATTDSGVTPLMACLSPARLEDVLEKYAGNDSSTSEERADLVKLLLQVGAPVDGKTMQCAVAGGMQNIIGECMQQITEMNKAKDMRLTVITETLLTHHNEVVRVKLVNRLTKAVSPRVYTLNTKLVQRLYVQGSGTAATAAAGGGGGGGGELSGVLLRFLDPAKYGFKEGDGSSASGDDDSKVVRLEYDGTDFSETGFEVLVKYLTTGGVEGVLVNKKRKRSAEDGSGANSSSSGSASSGSSGGGGGGGASSRESSSNSGDGTETLFNFRKAVRALQAAQYFCLDDMTEEVKRLMDIYNVTSGTSNQLTESIAWLSS